MNQNLAAAILATFRDADRVAHRRRLQGFSARQWRRSLYWLDASGMALYFLQRLTVLDMVDAVPVQLMAQLQQRQKDNRLRTAALLEECAALNAAFQAAGLRYANLKGFTLAPDYCPDLSLRCQMDCDFLIDRGDAKRCREILNGRGYSSVATKNHVMEFKTDAGRTPAVSDLYKVRPEKSVEVHLCDSGHSELHSDLLALAGRKQLGEASYPSLAAEDVFLSQAFHLSRHLRSEWTRISWLLEFRHCVMNHCDDGTFWEAVRELALQTTGGVLAVGIAVGMAEKAFGSLAPAELTSWSCRRLPADVNLWIQSFGNDVLSADFPGSKLYLILERAIGDEPNAATIRRRLFPWRPPAAIVAPSRGLSQRLVAARTRCSYFLFRLKFHIVAGFGYLAAIWRWKNLQQRPLEINPAASAECAATRAD